MYSTSSPLGLHYLVFDCRENRFKMYSLPLYFPSGTKVDPLGVMYSIDSYHDSGDKSSIHDVDPTKQLEKDQLILIKLDFVFIFANLKQIIFCRLLGTLNDRLDKHLSGLKKETKEVEDKKKKVIDGVHVSKRILEGVLSFRILYVRLQSQDKKGDRKKGGNGIPLKETLISTTPWKVRYLLLFVSRVKLRSLNKCKCIHN